MRNWILFLAFVTQQNWDISRVISGARHPIFRPALRVHCTCDHGQDENRSSCCAVHGHIVGSIGPQGRQRTWPGIWRASSSASWDFPDSITIICMLHIIGKEIGKPSICVNKPMGKVSFQNNLASLQMYHHPTTHAPCWMQCGARFLY